MNWTDQDARFWAQAWEDPTMVKGLKFIAKKVRPRRSAGPVAQGFDLSPVFIKSAGFYEGSQEVVDLIETLGKGKVESRPQIEIPEAFSYINKEQQNK
jgi:hypothetical protein